MLFFLLGSIASFSCILSIVILHLLLFLSALFFSFLSLSLASEIGTLFLVRRRLQEMYDDEENRRKIRNKSATSTSTAPKGEVRGAYLLYAQLFIVLISCRSNVYVFC